ncbi:MAG: sigma-54-dependent transcriptional regulator [Candidatus Zixiibacteriota bacterium]
MNNYRGHILLVDDDVVFAKVFGNELARMGFKVHQGYGTDIFELIDRTDIDIVILDIVMPRGDGIDLLRRIKKRWPSLEVIMLTGKATIENAVASMKEGAYDYFTKPVELDKVEQVLQRCLDTRRLKSQNMMLKSRLSDLHEGQLIGNSSAITEIKSLINRFSNSDSTVLIHGESGTGKELVANLIHKNSPRRDEPFIIVDCTALKESLLESELFGHEKGAFTGAVNRKHGIFEVADGGTIFLDEVGDVSPALQAKLLRVVETKSFRRLGGNERIVVDVRLIAATNRDLQDMVHQGKFREDLYYRLNVINIIIPPLREHKEDIEPLVESFLKELGKADRAPKGISPSALQILKEYHWPGNVRELKNVIERSMLLCEGDTIEAGDVPLRPSPLRTILNSYHGQEYPSLHDVEDAYIKWVLQKAEGNKHLAAKILKIDRKTLARRLGQMNEE